MADELENAPSAVAEKDTPSATPEPSPLLGGKFKSPDELVKAYQALESKYGDLSGEVGQSRQFAAVVQPLLEEIKNDPTLFKLLDEKLKAKANPSITPSNEPAQDTDVKTVASDLVIARFEEKHGIDKLQPEERKQLRQEIGDAIFELTGKKLDGVDLRRLEKSLEGAYKIATFGKSTPQAEDSDDDNRGSISSLPDSSGKAKNTLSSEEAHVAERLGLTREQYLSGRPSLAKLKS
jgi:hypothetical protein